MSSVWYTGLSDVRVIYPRDWAALGADAGTAFTWDRTNGFSRPTTDFTASQLAALGTMDGFWTAAPDGPRTLPVNADQVVTYLGLTKYLSNPGAVPGLNKATVGLGNVDNTADSVKPVSGPQAAALALKITAPTGGTQGQVVAVNADGSFGLVTPTTGATITQVPDGSVPSGITYAINGVGPFAYWPDLKTLLAGRAAQPPSAGTQGQVLQRDTSSTTGTSWATLAASGSGTVADASTTAKGVVQLAGDLAGTATAPTLKQIFPTAATFGSSTKHVQITRDTAGRITAIAEVDQAAPDGRVASTYRTAAYTLAATDAATVVEIDSPNAVVVTVPSGTFSAGDLVEVCQYGAGQVTLAGGSGVTLRTASSLSTRAQYASATLRFRSGTEAIVGGDLT